MKKEVKTVVAICDKCGNEGDTANSNDRNEWGEIFVKFKGHLGGRSYSGDAGGTNYEGRKWFCLDCTKKFLEFIGELA